MKEESVFCVGCVWSCKIFCSDVFCFLLFISVSFFICPIVSDIDVNVSDIDVNISNIDVKVCNFDVCSSLREKSITAFNTIISSNIDVCSSSREESVPCAGCVWVCEVCGSDLFAGCFDCSEFVGCFDCFSSSFILFLICPSVCSINASFCNINTCFSL